MIEIAQEVSNVANGKQEHGDDARDHRYVRPADVLRQTGLSKSSVFTVLWSGELEAYRKGWAWLIPVDAVDRWIKDESNAA